MKKIEPTPGIENASNPDGVSEFRVTTNTGSYKKIVFDTPKFRCTCQEDEVYHLFNIDNIETFSIKSIDTLNELYNELNCKKEDYQITGSYCRSIALQCLLNHYYIKECIQLIPTAYRSLDLWNKNLVSHVLKWKLQINSRDVTYLVAVREKGHCSLLLINNEEFYLLDTSLSHLSITKNVVKPSVFGNIKDIKIINPQKPSGEFVSIQINGTCSYWIDSFIQAIMTNKYFNSLKRILESIQNGMLLLESAVLMSKIFDNTNCRTFIRVDPDNISEDLTINYYLIKIHDHKYGIRKICWNNKFINLSSLLFITNITDSHLLNQANKQSLLLQPKIFMHNNCINTTSQLGFYTEILYQIIFLYKEHTTTFNKLFGLLRKIVYIVQNDITKSSVIINHLNYVINLIISGNLTVNCDEQKQRIQLFKDSRIHYEQLMKVSQSLDIGAITNHSSYKFFEEMQNSEKLLSFRVFFKFFTEALSEISTLNLETLFEDFEITRSEVIKIINIESEIKTNIEKLFQQLEFIEEGVI